MFDRTQEKLTKTSRLLIGFCVVVFGTWFIAAQFTQAADKGRDAVKQIEMAELRKSLVLYNLAQNDFPETLGESAWCEIGARYGDKLCLYELTRDGYFPSLPVSPDEHPYYYKHSNQGVYLAVVVDYDLNTLQHRSCTVAGIEMWCIEVDF